MSIINGIYICTASGERPVVASYTLEAAESMAELQWGNPIRTWQEVAADPAANNDAQERGKIAASALVQLVAPLDCEALHEAAFSLSRQDRAIRALSKSFMTGFEEALPQILEVPNV